MKIVSLTPEERLVHRASHKVVITYADVNDGVGAADVYQIFPKAAIPITPTAGESTGMPAGTLVRFEGMNLKTAFDFSDAAINSLLIEVGDAGDTDRFLASTEIAVDGTEILYKMGPSTTQPFAYLVADAIDILLTAAGGGDPTLAECTAGEIELYFSITRLDDLERG